MLLKFTALSAFLAIISLSAAYKITSNIIDGIPGLLNITTAPFVKIGSNYYYINECKSEGVIWYAAFESCRLMEADLIAFESLEELELISEYLIQNNMTSVHNYWTAGTDLAVQGKHVWFSNDQPVTKDLWFPGEPNNENNEEHCDELKFNHLGLGLNDRICSHEDGYICKAKQPKTASFIIW
ncbi:hypothetical protein KR084_001944 [Drosophila pseudotakahashii]|nr:hypothetical protein KR084_001944 [Drosophila pseudotakahashii]